jgi:hypothetical protein
VRQPERRNAEQCVECGTVIADRYCSHCGERRASDHRQSIGEFCHEIFEACVSVDGRALRTMLTLVRHPGELTAAYGRGVRKRYLSPLNCFLLANLVYFVWASAAGSDTLATTLAVHTQQTPYRRIAQAAVAARLSASHEDAAVFAARFDAMGRTQAKSLVVVMVPAFALIVALVAAGTGRPAVQHLVFAFHTYAVMFPILIFGQTFASLVAIGARLYQSSGPRQPSGDLFPSLVIAAAVACYLYVALRRVYAMRALRALLSTGVLLYALLVIVTAYRGLLFEATLRAIR